MTLTAEIMRSQSEMMFDSKARDSDVSHLNREQLQDYLIACMTGQEFSVYFRIDFLVSSTRFDVERNWGSSMGRLLHFASSNEAAERDLDADFPSKLYHVLFVFLREMIADPENMLDFVLLTDGTSGPGIDAEWRARFVSAMVKGVLELVAGVVHWDGGEQSIHSELAQLVSDMST